MDKETILEGLFALIVFIAIIFGIIGYLLNIKKLISLDFVEPYKAEILRTLGIIPTVGPIIGWIKLEDGFFEAREFWKSEKFYNNCINYEKINRKILEHLEINALKNK